MSRVVFAAAIVWSSTLVFGQVTATLTGQVSDPAGAAVPGAEIVVENSVTRYRRQLSSGVDGRFTVTNIPFHTYQVTITKPGFAPEVRMVSLRSSVPAHLAAVLQLQSTQESITVSASESALLVDPEETGTHIQMNQSDIDKLATATGTRGLEAALVSMPGFSQNANGAIHPRGAHNQMTYVIDGMPISDQLTGAFANAVDPNIAQTVELFTGNVPAEFGNKVSGVASVTTKSGVGSGRKFSGSTTLAGAGFGMLSQVTAAAGEAGRFGYSVVVNTMKSNRYLDQVSLDNLHNGGNSERAFMRLDYQAGARDTLRMNVIAGRSSFQLANLRSQHANRMDQRQLLRDVSISGNWVRAIDARTTLETSASYRPTNAQLANSGGDTPVTAAQDRHLSTVTAGFRVSTVRGRHQVRAGADWQHFPVSENFAFGVTSAAFNDPLSASFNPRLLPYDLTRGGTLFRFVGRGAGNLYSGFVQDNPRLGPFQLALGLRYDNYRFLSAGNQLQPRLGISYNLKQTGTVLRASYSRLYQTPPNENLLLSNSREAYQLAPDSVREALGEPVPIRCERQNFYELGLQQALFGRMSLNASYYHKDATDQQDNNNFLNTGIIFPISLRRIRVNGAEGRINIPPVRGIGATLSFTHARAVSTPPFTGGLYLGQDAVDALTSGPFVIDHDQVFSFQGMLNYSHKRGWYSSFSVRYDSGLVAGMVTPESVARDPDFNDLLPYVNLLSSPPRVNSRTICDLVAGYERLEDGRKRWDVSVQFTNLTNRTALYNFQSVFVGTRLVQPFTAGVRVRYYF